MELGAVAEDEDGFPAATLDVAVCLIKVADVEQVGILWQPAAARFSCLLHLNSAV